MTSKKRGEEFEAVVERICVEISKNERIKTNVEKHVPLIGDDGTSHEIDVLYSYEHFGVSYRVAIECKNWKNPINVSELRNFSYKLEHIGNINGIFISAQSEFQEGAKKVSTYNGIRLVKYDEIDQLLSGINEEYLIPDYNTIGDPFWMFMNINGRNSLEKNMFFNEEILLFESRYFAEQFGNQCLRFNHNMKLVGVSQSHLKEIVALKKQYKVAVKLFNQFTTDINTPPYHFWNLDVDDIEMYIR